MNSFFDKCGITVSGLCGVHCFALVAIALSQPFAVIAAQALPWLRPLEVCLAIAAGVFGVIAFVSGYRHHGHAKPVALGAAGLALLWSSIAPPLHDMAAAPLATFAGGMLLIIGHRWNIRCRCAHSHVAQEKTPA